ncbi:MAG: TIM44-like domain-containing protein [Methanobacterium sp.]|uniref:TIM44-like domain-containing protein n=1 Tax=Methanobacterium sp. TaxID=2164 RepID=UPI003D650016|nr:TIM44-like domain-containing protein [Methanobacterium sp.]
MEVFAHGGGRGGSVGKIGKLFSGSSGSGDPVIDTNFLIILISFIVISLIIIGIIVWRFRKKNKDAKELAGEIEKYDEAWNIKNIEERVEDTFYKVHEARKERNPDISKDYISESLYRANKAYTSDLIARNHINVLEKVRLKNVRIMGIGDYKKDEMDYFWAYITGSMYDYFIDDFTGKVVAGEPAHLHQIREMWKFTRGLNGWILDKVNKNILSDLFSIKSFSEGYGNDSNNGYLICEDCGGYYMLESNEYPEEFGKCQCGGNLIYYHDLDEFLGDDDF